MAFSASANAPAWTVKVMTGRMGAGDGAGDGTLFGAQAGRRARPTAHGARSRVADDIRAV